MALVLPEMIRIVCDTSVLSTVMEIWLKMFSDPSIEVIGGVIYHVNIAVNALEQEEESYEVRSLLFLNISIDLYKAICFEMGISPIKSEQELEVLTSFLPKD